MWLTHANYRYFIDKRSIPVQITIHFQLQTSKNKNRTDNKNNARQTVKERKLKFSRDRVGSAEGQLPPE